MNTVICPHCGKEVEISQALKHQIEESIIKDLTGKHKQELEKQKEEIKKEAEKHIKEEFEFKMKDSRNELEETRKKSQELQNQLLEMTKLIRDLKDKDQQRDLEMQKKLFSERDKLQIEITKTVQEKADLEKAEIKKQLEDTKKALEDAQRKADQKSQQLQGEVLELDLENRLKEHFPTDSIDPVPKGVDGADICQTVRNKHGQAAGKIIWETKRTKAWSHSWPSKLREDKRRLDASIAILVSDVLPEGVENFGLHENIWVTTYAYAIPLTNVLRMGLFEVAIAKATAAHKEERLESMFNYIINGSFRNRIEAQVESIIEIKNDLDTEKRSTMRLWKKRETQIERMTENISNLYGELQGIMGSSLPTIQNLEAAPILDGKTQKSLLEE
jgi:hypothetical protein